MFLSHPFQPHSQRGSTNHRRRQLKRFEQIWKEHKREEEQLIASPLKRSLRSKNSSLEAWKTHSKQRNFGRHGLDRQLQQTGRKPRRKPYRRKPCTRTQTKELSLIRPSNTLRRIALAHQCPVTHTSLHQPQLLRKRNESERGMLRQS